MTTTFLLILATSALIMIVSLSGIIFIWGVLKKFLEGNLHYLASFAAGVFLVVSITLGLEAIHLSPNLFVAGFSLATGVLLMYMINLIFPEAHHHHEHSHENCGHSHSQNEARRILASDSIHNLGDGVLLATAFSVNIQLGAITAIGIIIHEAVQEISEFFVLKESGYSTRQALTRNFLVSSTVLIGAVGGYFLVNSTLITAILLGVASGGFFYVVTLDLFPSSFRRTKLNGKIWKFVLAAVIGATLIVALNTISGHSHENQNDDLHGHDHENDH